MGNPRGDSQRDGVSEKPVSDRRGLTLTYRELLVVLSMFETHTGHMTDSLLALLPYDGLHTVRFRSSIQTILLKPFLAFPYIATHSGKTPRGPRTLAHSDARHLHSRCLARAVQGLQPPFLGAWIG